MNNINIKDVGELQQIILEGHQTLLDIHPNITLPRNEIEIEDENGTDFIELTNDEMKRVTDLLLEIESDRAKKVEEKINNFLNSKINLDKANLND